ncbi:MAG: inorganic phosphate transporter [bacterium]|nr:inorganic phosphate transporter [bacterium]MDD5756036.1 inorganic phosphate transporter [bacterium]
MAWLFWIAIILTVIYDILNGYNDGGSIIGTFVSTHFLAPVRIVMLVCFFELCGIFIIYYVGMRIVHSITSLSLFAVTPAIILAALGAAVIWKIITISIGIPTSSAHALVGGLAGAIIVAYGWQGISYDAFGKIIIILLATPVVSALLSYTLMHLELFCLRWATPQVNRALSKLQLLTVAVTSILHGATEPQKTMAVLVMILAAFGYQSDLSIPLWVVAVSVSLIVLGILAGGWRIAKTFNRRLLKIRPLDSVTTQVTTSIVILASALWGGTFSTSQVISSGLVGAGVAKRFNKVSWRVARHILIAWLVTIPVTGLLAMLFWKALSLYSIVVKGGLWV